MSRWQFIAVVYSHYFNASSQIHKRNCANSRNAAAHHSCVCLGNWPTWSVTAGGTQCSVELVAPSCANESLAMSRSNHRCFSEQFNCKFEQFNWSISCSNDMPNLLGPYNNHICQSCLLPGCAMKPARRHPSQLLPCAMHAAWWPFWQIMGGLTSPTLQRPKTSWRGWFVANNASKPIMDMYINCWDQHMHEFWIENCILQLSFGSLFSLSAKEVTRTRPANFRGQTT